MLEVQKTIPAFLCVLCVEAVMATSIVLPPSERGATQSAGGNTPCVAEKRETATPSWLSEVRERIAVVFAGCPDDFHRERMEMRLEAAKRLASNSSRTPLEDAELDEFRNSFDEAFGMWERDPLNPATQPMELSVRDFGAVGDGGTDDSTAFARAIEAVRTLGGAPSIFRIPAGDYYLGRAEPGRVEPRGNFHLDLSGLTNCAVVGESPESTRLEFGEYAQFGVSLDDSENCTLAALDISWRKAPFSQAVIESYDPSDFSSVVRHHPGTLLPTDLDPNKYIHVCALFSPEGKFIKNRGIAYPFFGRRPAEDLGGGRYRIWFEERPLYGSPIDKFAPLSGDIICIVDRMFWLSAVRIDGSSFCSFHRVWIRNSPAGTICGTSARYLTMDNCRTFPKSPDLMLSSNADTGYCPRGTHIAHCEFRNMGDDGVNVLGHGVDILRREDARSIIIRPLRGRLRIGDFQQIIRSSDGSIHDLRVASIRIVHEESRQFPGTSAPTDVRWVVTYEDDLPEGIVSETDVEVGTANSVNGRKPKADVAFTPLEWGVGFTMRGNWIHDARGRGACIQSPHTIVEDNVFENLLEGIHIAGRMGHREGLIPSDIVCRRNVIRDAAYGIRTLFYDIYGRRLDDEPRIRHLDFVSNIIERVSTPFDLRNFDGTLRNDFQGSAPSYPMRAR